MSTISLCMIVKNEEDILDRCLKSVKKLVDEIIIVDTGSTDKTIEIAKKYTNKVFSFKWINDFSAARNYSFSLATSDYLLWLDADDIIPKSTLNNLLKIKPFLNADVYMLKYATSFYNNRPNFTFYRERILKNCQNAKWKGIVHETIIPFGKIERLNYCIYHKKEFRRITSRNLKIYEAILKTRHLSPREQYYYGRELFDHKKYKKCINILTKFVNSNLGWSENIIDALYLISISYNQLNLKEQSLNALFKTFNYDLPRANICCKIGDHFFELKKYEIAQYWYTHATKCKDVSIKGGFMENVYYNYYPFLQLCCTNFYLGNIQKAIIYNEKASKFYNSEITQKNKMFFENYIKNS